MTLARSNLSECVISLEQCLHVNLVELSFVKSFHTLDTFPSHSTEAVPDGLSDEIDVAETTWNIQITILIIKDQRRKIEDNVGTMECYEFGGLSIRYGISRYVRYAAGHKLIKHG